MKRLFLSIFFISLFCSSFAQMAKSQIIYNQPEDRIIFSKYVVYIQNKTNLPTDQIIIETAKFFLDVPYVANTLEIEPEGLVVNLRELDCTTFLETVYALSMTAKSQPCVQTSSFISSTLPSPRKVRASGAGLDWST